MDKQKDGAHAVRRPSALIRARSLMPIASTAAAIWTVRQRATSLSAAPSAGPTTWTAPAREPTTASGATRPNRPRGSPAGMTQIRMSTRNSTAKWRQSRGYRRRKRVDGVLCGPGSKRNRYEDGGAHRAVSRVPHGTHRLPDGLVRMQRCRSRGGYGRAFLYCREHAANPPGHVLGDGDPRLQV